MLRRISLISTALVLLSAASVSASTHNITITGFSYPASTSAVIGDAVKWTNQTTFTHSTTQNTSLHLWTKDIPSGGAAKVTFFSAGSFPYHCRFHSEMVGDIKVSMTTSATSGSTTTTFTLHWGSVTAPSGFKYVVQKRAPGGSFVGFTSTTSPSGTFASTTKGTWEFRARLKRISTGAVSGFSPTLAISIH